MKMIWAQVGGWSAISLGLILWAWPTDGCPYSQRGRCFEWFVELPAISVILFATGLLIMLAALLPLGKLWSESKLRKRSYVALVKHAWKYDRLAVLGVASAVTAFVLWAYPDYGAMFSAARLPAIAAFLALAFILLLLRRR
jgi:hypothetical protein